MMVKSVEEFAALESGTPFSIRLPAAMPWIERHRVFYRTAHQEVTLTMRGGEKITGVLDEAPGYFSPSTKSGPRVWLRVPGRKTRKGVDVREVKHMKGVKAADLAEALTAFIHLNSPGATAEQVAEARAIVSKM